MAIAILATEGRDSLFGTAADEVSSLLAGDDFFNGGDGVDLVNGNLGNDTIIGGAGNDTLYGGKGDDNVFGSLDSDICNGNLGDDTVWDDEGVNTLRGGQGNDKVTGKGQLFGDFGNDTLSGGLFSNDTLTGGAGADFFYAPTRWTGNDRITDFNYEQGDRILYSDLYGITWGTNAAGEAYITYTNTTSSKPDHIILVGINANDIHMGWFMEGYLTV